MHDERVRPALVGSSVLWLSTPLFKHRRWGRARQRPSANKFEGRNCGLSYVRTTAWPQRNLVECGPAHRLHSNGPVVINPRHGGAGRSWSFRRWSFWMYRAEKTVAQAQDQERRQEAVSADRQGKSAYESSQQAARHDQAHQQTDPQSARNHDHGGI